MTEEFEKC